MSDYCFDQELETKDKQNGDRIAYDKHSLYQIGDRQIKPTDRRRYVVSIKKRKRGRRGGVKQRLQRRGYRPPLPSIILSNVRSIRNKFDTLTALARFDHDYKSACVICITETWLSPLDTDTSVSLDNFTLFRNDRDYSLGKGRGGGVCLYINDRWCKNVNVVSKTSTPDIEFLSLSLRPHYLPREFNLVNIVVVYIPPSASSDGAKQIIEEHTSSLLLRYPDSPVVIVGDFNHCQHTIPGLKQFVKCKTRHNNTLDLCYSNIKDAYTSIRKQPICNSDHNTILLIPTYVSKLKREKPIVKQQSVWSPDAIDRIAACFESTLWSTLMPEDGTIDEWTDVVTNYITFCVELCVEKKEIKIYPNNKPWVTKRLKCTINEKKIAYMSGDRSRACVKDKEIRAIIREEKAAFKQRMEEQLKSGDSMNAWQMIRQMGGVDPKKARHSSVKASIDVNELNNFYCRFDTKCPPINNTGPTSTACNCKPTKLSIEVDETMVAELFKRCKERKAPGPDNIHGAILKHAHKQLAVPFTHIFQRSIDDQSVPVMWKTSVIIPVPKKRCPVALNDYRPVALTSIVMKCLEKIIKCELLQIVYDLKLLDKNQFAYQHSLSVEDALLTVTNTIGKHLDQNPKNMARILYVDFSSAFNAMNTAMLLTKLCNMGMPDYLTNWFRSFLTQRPQCVKMGDCMSNVTFLSNGCPQGCVVSPILYILYTNDCTASYENCQIVKYADDTAILGQITGKESEINYFRQIDEFINWCQYNSLEINASKTKEQIFTNRNITTNETKPVIIKDADVEIVDDFKYLGVTISHNMNFRQHIETMCKKINQRMYILRKLRSFEVSKKTMLQIYNSLIKSVITFGITVWYGGCGVKEKAKVGKLIKESSKIINCPLEGIDNLHQKQLLNKAFSIINNKNHALYEEFKMLPSGRRYAQARCRTNRYKNTFVPSAIKSVNADDT